MRWQSLRAAGSSTDLLENSTGATMSRLAIRLMTLAMVSTALIAAPLFTARTATAGGEPTPSDSPPPPKSKKKTSQNGSGPGDSAFVQGYRTAYATIYQSGDYATAI